MNNTTTITNPILPAAGVRRRPAKVHKAHPTGFYDVAPLNPMGRGEIESCRDADGKLLHCRKNLKIAKFNIQTLFVKEVDKILQKTEEMTSNMRKLNIAICGIQEHRRVHTEDREHEINQYNDDPGYYLYTVSAWRNQVQAANGGVGIIISK